MCASVLLCGCFALSDHHYVISGLEEETDDDLQDYLEKVIDRQFEDLPETENAEDKARQELYKERLTQEDLQKALRARGYYKAEVTFRNEPDPLTGNFSIKKGEITRINTVTIEPEIFESYLTGISPAEGAPLSALDVLETQKKIYNLIQKDQCYFNLEVTHTAVWDQQANTADVIYTVKAGPKAKLGPVRYEGLTRIKESYMKHFGTWKEGDCFRREKIESLRTSLLGSGLFARADAKLPPAPDENGMVPVTMDMRERAHRTIRTGLSYYTDEGPGLTLGWEHRNLLGEAEKLETQAKLSAREQTLSLNITKPHFPLAQQSMTLSGSVGREDTDAYEKISIGSGLSLKHAFNSRLSGTAGVEFTVSSITEETGDENTYGLVSFPVGLTFDNRKGGALNPYDGWLLRGSIEPFYDVLGQGDPFFKTRAAANTYFGFGDNNATVLALRAALGSITGAATENIPANERFYAGGGGSIRGFGYQDVGPFEEGEPVGGRSLIEASSELRFKITNNFGAVTFVDAGSVTDEVYPEMKDLAVGVGAGLRYYTDFGPLRFDIATPVSGDENTDRNYQFYISIGQAF